MTPIITALAPLLGNVIKRVLPDHEKAAEIEKEIKLSLMDHAGDLESLRGEIVLAEAKSSSWLTSTWRPLLMMVMVVIIAVNYLIFPIANMFLTDKLIDLDLPDQLWNLLQIGVGGYIVGRSGEKMVDNWKDKK
jgi:hypothetical protein